MMNYFFFSLPLFWRSNQCIGRWRWTDHLPLANARRNTSGCRRHKRGRSVLCLSHGFMAHPGPVGRCPSSRMVMAASDSKCARRFDRSCIAQRTGNRSFIQLVPWLVLVATVIIVLRPILVRRDESGSMHRDITVALWPFAIAAFFWSVFYGGSLAPGLESS